MYKCTKCTVVLYKSIDCTYRFVLLWTNVQTLLVSLRCRNKQTLSVCFVQHKLLYVCIFVCKCTIIIGKCWVFFTKVLTALVSFAICLEGGSNLILKDYHAMVDILIPCEKGGRWPFPINANHFRITKYLLKN